MNRNGTRRNNGSGQAKASRHNGNGKGGLNNVAGPVLITGGAGFVGTNLAHRLLSQGQQVVLYDNLSRPGVEKNLEWLQETHGSLVSLRKADIRDFDSLQAAVRGVSQVFHFAAQVAVTTSLLEPFLDFEINARGTLNLLEAIRRQAEPPPLIFTSTNKVYGHMAEVKLRERDGRYEPELQGLRRIGFSEERPLHFHSPYGCSKGAACQYVQDYARTFGLKTVVFRMSCIYGPHQFGTEDQGWVAHFLIKALENSPITIYGDGKQVRDILFVEDLVDAFLAAQEHMESIHGDVFNIGGGPANTISLLELLKAIGELNSFAPRLHFSDWRTADQQYYVSDTRKFSQATGWKPKVGVRDGVAALYHWLRDYRRGAATLPVELTTGLRRRRASGLRVGVAKAPKLVKRPRAEKRQPDKIITVSA